MLARKRVNGCVRHKPPLGQGGSGPAIGRTGGAFTLIELLMVIVIIGVLMALILPAIMKSRTAALEARVVAEIKQIDAAITAFKGDYNLEPPSRFVIYLTQAGWNTGANAAEMRALIRRMWPQFDFTMPAGSFPPAWSGAPYVQTDAGGNNYVGLKSSECLMFFLGGIIDGGTPRGFSKNPSRPFQPYSGPNSSTSRKGPYMEFNIGQIKDIDGNGMPEFYDSLPQQQLPLLYFSSYEGKGYVTLGANVDLPSTGTNFVYLHDVYRQSSGSILPPPANTTSASAGTSADFQAYRPQSFQIISPGIDGKYGEGGVFNPAIPGAGLTTSGGVPDLDAYDNLTNFHSGRLNP